MDLEKKQKFIVGFAFFAIVFCLIWLCSRLLLSYLFPFVIGFIIAYFVQKPAACLADKFNCKKELCAAILSVFIYLFFVMIIFLCLWLLYSNSDYIVKKASDFSAEIQNFTEKINEIINDLVGKFDPELKQTSKKLINDTMKGFGDKIVLVASNIITDVFKAIPNFLISAIVTIVATCYIAKDYTRLKNFLKGIIQDRTYKNAVTIKNILTDRISKFVFGYLLLMLLTFCELLIGFLILEVENFFIKAFLIAIIDLFPVLGTGTVLVPWAGIMFLKGNYTMGIGLIVIYIIISVVRNFAEPKIIGKQIGIHPLFTLVSMFIGLKVAGVFGIILFPIGMIVVLDFYKLQLQNDF